MLCGKLHPCRKMEHSVSFVLKLSWFLKPGLSDRLPWADCRKLRFLTSYRPGGGKTICPPPMAVRLMADLHPSAAGSAVRTSLVAGGGYSLGSCALGQTDGWTDRGIA